MARTCFGDIFFCWKIWVDLNVWAIPIFLFFLGRGEYLKSFQCIFRVNQMKCILVAPTNGPFKGGMVCSFHETRLETFKMQCYLSNGSFLEILFIFYIRFPVSEYMPSYSLAFVVLVVSSNLLFVLGQRRPRGRDSKTQWSVRSWRAGKLFPNRTNKESSKLRKINCRFHFPNRTTKKRHRMV